MKLVLVKSNAIPTPLLCVALTAVLWLAMGESTLLRAAQGAPAITTAPASATKCPGQSVTFTVVATGNAPLGYQWRKDGIALAAATNTAYSITFVSAADAGSYTVVVSNSVGTVTSAAATLTVNTAVSASPLTNLVRSVGANAVFSTTASGTGPFSYAWD